MFELAVFLAFSPLSVPADDPSEPFCLLSYHNRWRSAMSNPQIVRYVFHDLRVGPLNGGVNKNIRLALEAIILVRIPDLRFSCATLLQKRANARMLCTDGCELRQSELGNKVDRTMQAFRATLRLLS